MRVTRTILVPILFLLITTALSADSHRPVKFPEPPPPRNDVELDNRVPVPMRDGVILYADVYRPVGDGKYPVSRFTHAL